MRELTDLELDILKILADNKGHALWELVKLLGKEKSNLIILLNRLEEEIELTNLSKIGNYDIIDKTYFEHIFRDPKDPLSQYIREQFRPGSKGFLDPDIDDFRFSTYFVLEKVLDDPNLFDEKRFAHIAVNEKIQELIRKKPEGQDLRCLNRLLLEEAYPEGIVKSRTSIIYKGISRKTTNPDSRQPRHHEIPYFITVNPLVLKFLILNIELAYKRSIPRLCKNDRNKLEKLREQVEWKLISESDYQELKDKLEYEMYGNASWDEAIRDYVLLDKLLSSQYALEFIKRYSFKQIVYRIHDLVGSWDRCWAFGKNAIDSGVIKEEADLECAEKLLRWHQSVEEGFREQDRRMKDGLNA